MISRKQRSGVWPCHCTRPGDGDQEIRVHPLDVAQCRVCGARQVDWREFSRHDAAIKELVAAARDMVEQAGAFIDLDERVDDPKEHDLFDVLGNLERATVVVRGLRERKDR